MKLLLLLLVLVGCSQRPCLQQDKIVKVGGCNKHGHCSYITESGIKDSDYLPVEGEIVCVRR